MSKTMSKEQIFQNMENIHNNTCVVCYKNVEIYSIGMCEHPVCYECSTRMRVLCCQNECPICRQDLPKVVFTREVKPFRFLQKGSLFDARYHIYFDSEDIQQKFNNLLNNTCAICKDKQSFNSFHNLKDHMRREHELHYCDLCVENLKIFSHERRCYTRAELAQHRRKGDIDDKSHKGHPLCEFCDQRYMDNDELYRHLRRDHLYCHFCDADGLHQYYNSYDYLRDHFRQEHFLCEEGPCIDEKFTSVFRTDIDLKAHKTSVHGKQLSKAAAKQARTLELEFTLAPRGDNRNNRRGIGGLSTSKNAKDLNNSRDQSSREYQQPTEIPSTSNYFPHESDPVFVRQPTVDVQSTAEFPTLGNTAPFIPNTNQTKGRGGNVTIRSTVRSQPLAVTDENFPALGPETSNASLSKTVNFSLTSSNKPGLNLTQTQQSTSNVSIEVNHESNGMVTTRVSGPNIRIRPWMESDFPALGASNPSISTSSNSANPIHWKESLQWTFSKSRSTPATTKSKKSAAPLVMPSLPAIQSGEDFPKLPKGKVNTKVETKSKKQSVMTVMPNSGQPSTSTNGTKNTLDVTKSKSKKKKAKPPHSSNNSNCSETGSSKFSANVDESEQNNNPNTTNIEENSASSILQIEQKMPNKDNSSQNVKSENTQKIEQLIKKEKKKNKNVIIASISDDTRNAYEDATSSSSNNVQRKRTELKIHSLNSTNNNVSQEEKLPDMVSNKSAPPGFTNPPPGFSTVPQSSPGLYVKLGNIEELKNSNGLTFTNSSGESYSILPDNCSDNNTHTYVPPPDFQKRNKNLVAKINQVLKRQEQIEDFRYVSGFFRRGTCNVVDYYTYCKEVIGSTSFESIFPELLTLLPDITKQQELFSIYKKEFNDKVMNLEACKTCGQIVKTGNDFVLHMSAHTLENDFPLLGRGSMVSAKNNWVRK